MRYKYLLICSMELMFMMLIAIMIETPNVKAQALIMPPKLVEHAGQYGCGQIRDFFEVTESLESPFVFGVFPGSSESILNRYKSYAYWCELEKIDEEGPIYMLVFGGEDLENMKCSKTIKWAHGPGGLWTGGRPESLRLFRRLDGKASDLSEEDIDENDIYIQSLKYDSELADRFLCHRGVWLFQQVH